MFSGVQAQEQAPRSATVGVVERELLKLLPELILHFGRDLLPRLARQDVLLGEQEPAYQSRHHEGRHDLTPVQKAARSRWPATKLRQQRVYVEADQYRGDDLYRGEPQGSQCCVVEQAQLRPGYRTP